MSYFILKIGDICEVKRGTTITQKNSIEGNVPVVAGGIKTTYFHNASNRLGKTITISGSGANAGYINFWDIPIFASDCSTVQVFRDDISIYYIYYFLLSKQEFIYKELRSGMAQPHVYGKDIANIELAIPPLSIQHKIVEKLDKIFAEIDKGKAAAEANIKNTEALFQSYLSNLFVNNTKKNGLLKLSDLCEFKQGIQVDVSKQSEKLSNGKVRFLRIVDFTSGNETPRYIDNPGGQYFVRNNDVSLVRYGASGFVCKGLEGVIANNLFQVKPKNNSITKEYLFWYLYSPKFQNFIKGKMSGAAMPAINFRMINDFEMNLLPIEEQELIVKNCESFNSQKKKLISIYQSKVSNFEVYRQFILKQAFNGELVKAA